MWERLSQDRPNSLKLTDWNKLITCYEKGGVDECIIHGLQGTSVFTSYLSSGLFFSVPTDPGFTGVTEAGEAEFIHEAVAVHIL